MVAWSARPAHRVGVQTLAPGRSLTPLGDLAHRLRVGEQLEGLLESVEVVRRDDDGLTATVPRDRHPLMRADDPVDHLGQVRLDGREGHGV